MIFAPICSRFFSLSRCACRSFSFQIGVNSEPLNTHEEGFASKPLSSDVNFRGIPFRILQSDAIMCAGTMIFGISLEIRIGRWHGEEALPADRGKDGSPQESGGAAMAATLVWGHANAR